MKGKIRLHSVLVGNLLNDLLEELNLSIFHGFFKKWNSLLGCVIVAQPKYKSKNQKRTEC